MEAALERDIPLIPVFVQGATMPSIDLLPSTLSLLVYRHGIHVRTDPDFHGDVDRLIRGIEQHFKGR